MAIDLPTAQLILAADLVKAAQVVRRYALVDMTQDQFDACVDFAFNLGPTAFENSTMLKCINRGDFQSAAEEAGRWVHDHYGHVEPGLVTRRAWDAARLYPTLTTAQTIVYVASILPPDGVVADSPTIPTLAPDGTFIATDSALQALVEPV